MDLWGRKDSNLQINYFTYNLRWNCESWLSFRKKSEYSSVLPICILPQIFHYFKELIINCILIIPYFIQFKKFNSKKNWKIFTEGLEPPVSIRERISTQICARARHYHAISCLGIPCMLCTHLWSLTFNLARHYS